MRIGQGWGSTFVGLLLSLLFVLSGVFYSVSGGIVRSLVPAPTTSLERPVSHEGQHLEKECHAGECDWAWAWDEQL